jgi:hypothetical protein
MSSWFILIFYIFILIGFIYLILRYHRQNDIRIRAECANLILGLYMNEEQSRANHFTQEPGKPNIFNRHVQGHASYTDETWKLSSKGSHIYLINAMKHAVVENDTILIYDNFELIETLKRSTTNCSCEKSTEEPTPQNFKLLYKLVMVKPEQVDTLASLLASKKICAMINDVYVHTGASSNTYMAGGVFAMDKRNSIFFYIPQDTLSALLMTVKLTPITVDVSTFEPLIFSGAMVY